MTHVVIPFPRNRAGSGKRLAMSVFPEAGHLAATDPERFWWSTLVDDETYRNMILDIERSKGKLSAHERECAVRYESINKTMAEMKASIDLLVGKERAHERKLSGLQITTLVFVIGTMLTMMGWMTVQLYNLDPLRAAPAEQRR